MMLRVIFFAIKILARTTLFEEVEKHSFRRIDEQSQSRNSETRIGFLRINLLDEWGKLKMGGVV